MLRDAAGFTGRNVRGADLVQQAGLAVIDVPEHGRHHRTPDEMGAFAHLEFLSNLFFRRALAHDLQLGLELQGDQFGHFVRYDLVGGHHSPLLHQLGDDVGRFDCQSRRQILDRDGFTDRGFPGPSGGGFPLRLGRDLPRRTQPQPLAARGAESRLSFVKVSLTPLSVDFGLLAGFLFDAFFSATVSSLLVVFAPLLVGVGRGNHVRPFFLVSVYQRLGDCRVASRTRTRTRSRAIQRLGRLDTDHLWPAEDSRLGLSKHGSGGQHLNLHLFRFHLGRRRGLCDHNRRFRRDRFHRDYRGLHWFLLRLFDLHYSRHRWSRSFRLFLRSFHLIGRLGLGYRRLDGTGTIRFLGRRRRLHHLGPLGSFDANLR